MFHSSLLFAALLVHCANAAVTLKSGQGFKNEPVPVVLWHGLGDDCCSPDSMGRLKKLIEETIGGGVYVKSLMIGQDRNEDSRNSYTLNANSQVAMACEQLSQDEKLSDGFHAVGLSQGAQFLRAYVQRCNSPPVKTLVSLGGQHQGISAAPHCPSGHELCDWLSTVLSYGAYTTYAQNHVAPAGYWHDPMREEEYKSYCSFLPDINNEGAFKNETYKENIKGLEKLVLIKFANDTMVKPPGTEWFGWFKNGSDTEMAEMRETPLYKEDWLGLQWLDENRQLLLENVEGDHLEFDDDWFKEHVVKRHLM